MTFTLNFGSKVKKLAFLLFALAPAWLTASCANGVLDRFLTSNTITGDCGNYSLVNNGPVSFVTNPAPPVGMYYAGTYATNTNLTATAALITAWKSLTSYTLYGVIRLNSLGNLTNTFYSWGTISNQLHLNLLRFLNTGAPRLFKDGTFVDGPAGAISINTDTLVGIVCNGTDIRVYISPFTSVSAVPVTIVAATANRSDIDYISFGIDKSGVSGASDCPMDGYINDLTLLNVAVAWPPPAALLNSTRGIQIKNNTRLRLGGLFKFFETPLEAITQNQMFEQRDYFSRTTKGADDAMAIAIKSGKVTRTPSPTRTATLDLSKLSPSPTATPTATPTAQVSATPTPDKTQLAIMAGK